ncbi:hypothetical protein KP79_PYT04019 [Mizuhopecten yessoensis]|uniref:Uncharacterized protein n=2 Tax=Mizuhopecten yessoensis TaxID=6573 RepID=A0A210QMH1_MIZYE|nr:hypothetical protein KP79_PYT04019 [Mizuhopecten yessoensis]
MGGAISTIGNTPEFSGHNRYISFPHRRHRVDYSEQAQRSNLQDPVLSERHDNERSVGGTALKQRRKKTFKQIVQEKLVIQIIHHYIAWDICTVPVEKAATFVLPSSIFLSTAVERFCAARVFKLLKPVLQPVVSKLNQGIEKRVGPEAEERKQNIIFKRYGLST